MDVATWLAVGDVAADEAPGGEDEWEPSIGNGIVVEDVASVDGTVGQGRTDRGRGWMSLL